MLKVFISNLGRIAWLQVRGEIVIGADAELLRSFVVKQTEVSAVVLDVAQVSRIDARGLGLLLELRGLLQTQGIEFRLTNVNVLMKQILQLTCLDTVFEISSEETFLYGDSIEEEFAVSSVT